ncbi:hypothetical protein GDO81_023105 [Engystomops pustulosus]|uniref:Uncharacterized protein n=1 Tax=Engystomops pustulosus TaxID=76066 RepID=A0AAV6Z3E6_ENGPU|nr:hypothetical protein GDO81_023105 [Engystomops pustulosus]
MTAHNPRHNPTPSHPRVPFVHTYHPASNKILHILRRHWSILTRALPEIPEFQQPPLPCRKRPKNLRDSVIRADIGSNLRTPRQQFLRTPKKGTFKKT